MENMNTIESWWFTKLIDDGSTCNTSEGVAPPVLSSAWSWRNNNKTSCRHLSNMSARLTSRLPLFLFASRLRVLGVTVSDTVPGEARGEHGMWEKGKTTLLNKIWSSSNHSILTCNLLRRLILRRTPIALPLWASWTLHLGHTTASIVHLVLNMGMEALGGWTTFNIKLKLGWACATDPVQLHMRVVFKF